jgi:hypothetical protein
MDARHAWRPRSQALDTATLPKGIARHPNVVVHFWAAWNLHDRKMDESEYRMWDREVDASI